MVDPFFRTASWDCSEDAPEYERDADEADEAGWSKLMYLALGLDVYKRRFSPAEMEEFTLYEIEHRKANLEYVSQSAVDRALGKTPLSLAVEHGNLLMVEILLASGAKGMLVELLCSSSLLE